MQVELDARKLGDALAETARERGVSYRHVSRVTGVCPSTISRLVKHGEEPSADGLVKLAVWIGLTEIERYVRWGERQR